MHRRLGSLRAGRVGPRVPAVRVRVRVRVKVGVKVRVGDKVRVRVKVRVGEPASGAQPASRPRSSWVRWCCPTCPSSGRRRPASASHRALPRRLPVLDYYIASNHRERLRCMAALLCGERKASSRAACSTHVLRLRRQPRSWRRLPLEGRDECRVDVPLLLPRVGRGVPAAPLDEVLPALALARLARLEDRLSSPPRSAAPRWATSSRASSSAPCRGCPCRIPCPSRCPSEECTPTCAASPSSRLG